MAFTATVQYDSFMEGDRCNFSESITHCRDTPNGPTWEVKARSLLVQKVLQGFRVIDPTEGGTYDEDDDEYNINTLRRYVQWKDDEYFQNWDPCNSVDYGDELHMQSITNTINKSSGVATMDNPYSEWSTGSVQWTCGGVPQNLPDGQPNLIQESMVYDHWLFGDVRDWRFAKGTPCFAGIHTGVTSMTSYAGTGGSWALPAGVENARWSSVQSSEFTLDELMDDYIHPTITAYTMSTEMGADANWSETWSKGYNEISFQNWDDGYDIDGYDFSDYDGALAASWTHNAGGSLSSYWTYRSQDILFVGSGWESTPLGQGCRSEFKIPSGSLGYSIWTGLLKQDASVTNVSLLFTGTATENVPVEIPYPSTEMVTYPYCGRTNFVTFP